MYTLSSSIKKLSYALMILGFIGVVYGFLSAPATVDDLKVSSGISESHAGNAFKTHESHEAHTGSDKAAHTEHLLHQLQNRPWSALYVGAFFVMMLSLGVLVFYAAQRVAQAGWSPVLFRVMEAITAYLLPGLLIVAAILVLSALHVNHLFVWMAPEAMHDEILQGKALFLNIPSFLIRMIIYASGWLLYRYFVRRNSLQEDITAENTLYKKNFKLSVFFLVFFFVSESLMAWDWIMSLDPHWFSTLFGWYIFSSMFVSGVTVIAMVTIYLKSKGYLEKVNDSHLHDLAKFMFGLSIFWTYLWFAQFMLIWYSNIPEEASYFLTRFEHYKLPFFGMLGLNFIFPVLLLMNSDFKRNPWFVVIAGIVILFGHYIDIFMAIMPATVGSEWFIGIPEIGSLCLFAGLFILVVFAAMTKAPLIPKNHPLLKESEHFHY